MVVKKAYKCYFETDKGIKLIDTTMGSGAQIIGHNNPLIKKIGKQIKRGTIYTIPNVQTNEVNFYLKEYINPDFHEEYVFCNSPAELEPLSDIAEVINWVELVISLSGKLFQ